MFVGQERIIRELELICKAAKSGQNFNLLFAAPSGMGKTTLALNVLSEIDWEGSQVSYPPRFWWDDKYRLHFLDEVHMLESPENIYPKLSSGDFFVVLATNETGDLLEPLVNRCIVLEFEPYTPSELVIMAHARLPNLDRTLLERVAEYSQGTPRVLDVICRRLSLIFQYKGIPTSVDTLDELIEDFLSIDRNGLTPYQRSYISALQSLGGKSSLDRLSAIIGLSKATILRDVEPGLLVKGMVRIGPRGREL